MECSRLPRKESSQFWSPISGDSGSLAGEEEGGRDNNDNNATISLYINSQPEVLSFAPHATAAELKGVAHSFVRRHGVYNTILCSFIVVVVVAVVYGCVEPNDWLVLAGLQHNPQITNDDDDGVAGGHLDEASQVEQASSSQDRTLLLRAALT
jgi:hypothetical protein